MCECLTSFDWRLLQCLWLVIEQVIEQVQVFMCYIFLYLCMLWAALTHHWCSPPDTQSPNVTQSFRVLLMCEWTSSPWTVMLINWLSIKYVKNRRSISEDHTYHWKQSRQCWIKDGEWLISCIRIIRASNESSVFHNALISPRWVLKVKHTLPVLHDIKSSSQHCRRIVLTVMCFFEALASKMIRWLRLHHHLPPSKYWR